MATMTRSDLVEKMKGRKGAFFVTIVAETAVNLQITNAAYATAALANAELVGNFVTVENAVSSALNKFGT